MQNATARRGKSVDVRAAIAAERRELADLFDTLRTDQWNEQSLCVGWRVRDVAAHMSMGFRLSLPAILGQLTKARGNLHRMTDRVARRDSAAHSSTTLAAFLRDNAHHPWTPPVGGLTAALGHGVQLCAEDLDWSYGSGSPMFGAAQDLLLLAYGRRLPDGRLRGEPSSRFTRPAKDA
ncbi:hypothetical protein SSP35_20_00730 [Streptomyces sp. NBRC 110611]|uniref:maleylpyruvate isomerase N-terminal domain-containing protein n=1 Tax=Streptomyces sp. NBRC 110611 TaxID=1621259 RepID=UPI00082BEEFB|nr:maleylpyruvate isomerase N-terminal domain-containing protein [Streptomyces sp. NBRC 110611]GAU70577.1 hypothetical protein SSP35_20_00730 [Streptomyces sp. NBRC 110611]